LSPLQRFCRFREAALVNDRQKNPDLIEGKSILLWLAVLYRFGPSRRQAKWRWISPGSIFAMLVWLGGSALFSWYLSNFADYDATYGSLGAAIGLKMWLWLSVIVILVGGQLNAEIEHQNRARHDHRRRKAPWRSWGCDGRYSWKELAIAYSETKRSGLSNPEPRGFGYFLSVPSVGLVWKVQRQMTLVLLFLGAPRGNCGSR
jgi:hypothetical protein